MITAKRTLATISATGAFLVVALSAAAAASPWLDPNWSYRVPITVEPDSVHGTLALVEFPMLVALNGLEHGAVFDGSNSDGSDIVFTEADGVTTLPREVVSFDAVGRKAEIWVKVATLAKSQNQFYLYYGNGGISLPPQPPDAWGSAYRTVYHFEDDPGGGVLRDSSQQEAHAALVAARGWTSGDVGAGQVGQSWVFNGSTHHIATKSISCQDSSYVISAWLEHTVNDVDFAFQSNPGFWHVSSQVNGQNNQPDFAGGGLSIRWTPRPIPINDGYHHFLWVFDSVNDTLLFYYDGAPQPVQSTFPIGATVLYTGRPINPANSEPVGVLGPMFFNGVDMMTGGGDEFRLRAGTLSADWVRTEVSNQRSPSLFMSFDAEEVFGVTAAGPAPVSAEFAIQSYPNPCTSEASISFRTSTPGSVHLAVYDIAGRMVAHIFEGNLPAGQHIERWGRRTSSGSLAAAGVYFLRISTPTKSASTKVLLTQ